MKKPFMMKSFMNSLRIILGAIIKLFRNMNYQYFENDYTLYFSEILTKMARNNVFWRYFCNYFPLKLVKTVDLDPKKSYLFVSVPHGILSIGIFGSFASDVLDCKKLFPGLEIRAITLDQHFKIPIFREYPYSLGKNL